LQHGPVAGLKNVQGEKVVGEKDGLGQNHDPYLFWKRHSYLHTPLLGAGIGYSGVLGIDGKGFLEETYFLHIYVG
jgi:hypothetical protein